MIRPPPRAWPSRDPVLSAVDWMLSRLHREARKQRNPFEVIIMPSPYLDHGHGSCNPADYTVSRFVWLHMWSIHQLMHDHYRIESEFEGTLELLEKLPIVPVDPSDSRTMNLVQFAKERDLDLTEYRILHDTTTEPELYIQLLFEALDHHYIWECSCTAIRQKFVVTDKEGNRSFIYTTPEDEAERSSLEHKLWTAGHDPEKWIDDSDDHTYDEVDWSVGTHVHLP